MLPLLGLYADVYAQRNGKVGYPDWIKAAGVLFLYSPSNLSKTT